MADDSPRLALLTPESERELKEKSSEDSYDGPDLSALANGVVRNLAWLGAVVIGAAIALGYISVKINPIVGGLAFAGMAGLAYALQAHDDSVSITFAISMAVVGVFLLEYIAPSSVVSALPFEGVVNAVDPIEFAVVGAFVILSWWIIDIRFIKRSGVKAETVAKRVGSRTEDLLEEWLSVGRVLVITGIGVSAIILDQIGMIGGEIASYAAEVPYLAADVLAIGIGYLSLGGELPVVGGVDFIAGIDPGAYLIITGAILGVAVGVHYAD